MDSRALFRPARSPSITRATGTPRATCSTPALTSAPAITVAVVVPSPTSSCCALAMLISILAAGWFASIMVSMVTPSLVITTSPNLSTSMVSSPFGPSVPSTALAIARIALELVIKAAIFSSTSDPAAASLIKLNGSNLLSSPAQYHPVEGPGQIFRQVIHYTDHFSVIHPGRAKHADGADLAAAQGVGRGNHAVIPDIVVFDLSAYSDRYDFITALA